MARTEDDSWDITQSVGVTALGVAAARAAETARADPLIEDRFARLFVQAAGPGMWTWYGGAVPQDLARAVPELPARMRMMIDFIATRTRFIDQFFLDAADAGLRQVVILAAGLDARAWRLPWPAGTVVYELDQPRVLEFKAATLRDHEPACRRVGVAIDLRQDWPTPGRLKGCFVTCPATPRTCCSSASMRSACPAAGSSPTLPPRRRATRSGWPASVNRCGISRPPRSTSHTSTSPISRICRTTRNAPIPCNG
jgi:hypothetical protein